MRSVIRLVTGVALLAALVLATPVVAQDAPALADRTPQDSSWLSQYAGWTVWSEVVNDRYLLFARRAGRTKLLPAPPSPITQDPGAGRGPSGRPAAVYQRCVKARCEIWAVDLATAKQRRVAGLGAITRGVARATSDDDLGYETHPRLWDSRVVFQSGRAAVSKLRVGPSAAGRGVVRTVRAPDDEGLLTQIALGPKHVVGLFQNDLCFGRGCSRLIIIGIDSGRRTELDNDVEGESCIVVFDAIRFAGSAFRWSTDRTAEDSGDTRCKSSIRRYRYDPRTGRTTRG